jgi:hypothetical protein
MQFIKAYKKTRKKQGCFTFAQRITWLMVWFFYFTSMDRKICGMATEPLPISPISCYIAVWKWEPAWEPKGQAQGNAFPEVY